MIRFALIVASSALLSLMAACGSPPGSESESVQLSFTAAEQASLDKIFADLGQASRRGFETGDWSTMAKLYPSGALACWDDSQEDHRFGFLSMQAIPETAEYHVASLDNYIYGGVDTSRMGGTHFMSVRYETSFAVGCDWPGQKQWPEKHFYLKKVGEAFELVHPCPMKEDIERKRIARLWPVVSGADAAKVLSKMDAAERQSLRERVRAEQFPLNAIYAIERRHNLSYDQASLVLDKVCGSTRP